MVVYNKDTVVEERYLLGSLVDFSNDCFSIISSLDPEVFQYKNHMQLANAIKQTAKKKSCSIQSLLLFLDRSAETSSLKGYVVQIQAESKGIDREYYYKVVKDEFFRRSAIKLALEFMERIKSNSPAETVSSYLSELSSLLGKTEGHEIHAMKDLTADPDVVKEAILTYLDPELRKDTIKTGFRDVDYIINGFKKGNQAIIGARPAVGKTALMCALAKNIALAGHPVLLASLEMTKEELLSRFVFAKAKTEKNKCLFSEEEKEHVLASKDSISTLPIHIIDRGVFSIEALESAIVKSIYQHGTQVVFVDYVQLLRTKEKTNSRYEEVSLIARRLKEIAKNNSLVIIALCQLNREVESKESGIPSNSNLRDSGELEAAADQIFLLYSTGTELNVKISKNRHGPEGTIKLVFIKSTGEIKNYDLF